MDNTWNKVEVERVKSVWYKDVLMKKPGVGVVRESRKNLWRVEVTIILIYTLPLLIIIIVVFRKGR